jgi:hypothetical protein
MFVHRYQTNSNVCRGFAGAYKEYHEAEEMNNQMKGRVVNKCRRS